MPPNPIEHDHVEDDAMSDGELARACARGDHRSFDVLARRHRPTLLAVCRRITSSDDDAHDAVQETLLSAWRGIARFDGRCKVSTWLYRIAVNEAIDVRARSRRAPCPVAELPDLPDRGPAPDQVVERMVIDAALAGMPTVFRSAVVLRDLLDLSYADVAGRLDIKVDTVKSRLSRGRRALRPVLHATVPEPV
jgi:RNA polymerase sigma-70 factor (ECF subfamily)